MDERILPLIRPSTTSATPARPMPCVNTQTKRHFKGRPLSFRSRSDEMLVTITRLHGRTAPVFRAVWQLRLRCIARACKRFYFPSVRPVRFRRASGSGRSASPLTDKGCRSLSALHTAG
jgi:hypothetical protein